MSILEGIIGFVIAAILFAVKNWADIKASKKAISELLNEVEDARADDNISDAEKARIADKALAVMKIVIPVLTNVWKFNWKKRRKIGELMKK